MSIVTCPNLGTKEQVGFNIRHADQYEIPVKKTTYVLKTTTYRESVEIGS